MSPDRWRQIEDLYNAIQSRPGEQVALLSTADPDIRSEVERMLSAENGLNFLDNPALDLDATATVLTPGQLLGPYQLTRPIGHGGMGQVFLAHDPRLGRNVAIKTSLTPFDQRFQREARAIAALNHPNICTLYDVGPNFLVMELIDGVTLFRHIRDRTISVADAARFGIQIASALAEAHSQNIVHRDLKPANVMVTRHGLKVLDFGLAKLATDPGSDLTHTNVVMGTPAYMAPEQAAGQPADARADMFSLGLILYEMAAGQLPFPGASLGSMLSGGSVAIPPPSQFRPSIPPAFDSLVLKLLAKDPASRYQSMPHVISDLRAIEVSLTNPSASAPPSASHSAKGGRMLLAAIAAGVAAVGAWFVLLREPAAPIAPPNEWVQLTNFTDAAVAPALSPDGRTVAFIRGGPSFLSNGQVYVKQLPNGEAVRLSEGTQAKYGPVFSPDGQRVAYTWRKDGWDTWTVPVTGGTPTKFLPNASGLTWMSDGRLLYSAIMGGGLHMGIVSSTDSRANEKEIYFPPHERAMAHYAFASPDRKSALIVEMDRTATWQRCRLLPLDGTSAGEPVGPVGACTAAAWSTDGEWMYFSSSTEDSAGTGFANETLGNWHLWRQRFPDGTPQQLTFGPTEQEGVAMAPDGKSIVTSVGNRRSEVWLHDAMGDRPLSTEGFTFRPLLADSGKRVYYLLRQNAVSELWSMDIASGKKERLLPGASVDDFDVSSDEKELAYTTQDGKVHQIWLAPTDRSSPPRAVAQGDQVFFTTNGELIYRKLEEKASFIYRVKKDGSAPQRVTNESILSIWSVHPNGDWVIAGRSKGLAIAMFSTRNSEIVPICNYDCPARWSPDGKYFYLTTERTGSTAGRTLAIPLSPGQVLPKLPAGGVTSRADRLDIPGIIQINTGNLSVGNDPGSYVYAKQQFLGNLFRLRLE